MLRSVCRAGGRGAASAESFLEQGYAVIFLNRKRSMQPFERQVGCRRRNPLCTTELKGG
jgi:hypothetical protein